MTTYKTPIANMSSFCVVDPTGGNRRQWQDFSSTRTLPLRWRPRHEKLSALDVSHNKTKAKTTSPSRHSKNSIGLIPHPQDKQEEETAAGHVNHGRTSKKATSVRQMNKIRQTCSLSIRRIFLLRPPAAGGEHLPSRSQTTSASTLPSGSTLAQCKERRSLVGPS